MERHLSEGVCLAMALELITGELLSLDFPSVSAVHSGANLMIVNECPYLQMTFLPGQQTHSRAHGRAPLSTPGWTTTEDHKRASPAGILEESREADLSSERWGHGSPTPYPCLCTRHEQCIPASPCPQLAPSPALAYPPASALRVSFGICFGRHLAISFSRRFPPSIWSSFLTTFPAQSMAVLGQGVATKCVPVQLHCEFFPIMTTNSQLTNMFVGNHLYPSVLVRRNCL